MKTSSCKAKGRRLQDKVKNLILQFFPSLTELDVRGAIMGEVGTDIKLSKEAMKVFPYSVECKNTEKLNIWNAIKQAEKNNKHNLTPLVVFSRNHSKTYVALEINDFFKLIGTPLTSTEN